MPLVTPEAFAQEQWQQIIANIEAEMNVGPTGPGSGTNPTGRLQQLWYCHPTIDMWTGKYPVAAVQLMDTVERVAATHRMDVESHFIVRIAAQSTPQSAAAFRAPLMAGVPAPANLDDAMAQLQTLISDGEGNGLSPVLRDRNNFNLKSASLPNGVAYETRITGIKFDWEMDAGNNQHTVLAYCTYSFLAKVRVTI